MSDVVLQLIQTQVGAVEIVTAGPQGPAGSGEAGSATWGAITGTLSNQSDLASALAGKLGTTAPAADVNPSGTSIASALASKLSTSGTAADVNPAGTSIAAALAGKLSTTGTAADVNVSGTAIAAALAGKANTSHTHTASQISDSTATGRSVLTAADASAARTAIGAGTSSFSGLYADLTNKPTLGTSASRDVGTTTGTVAAGDDSRLSNARTPTTHASTHATGQTDALTPAAIGAEASLGNPDTSGKVLASTTGGVRSWVAQNSYTLPTADASTLGGVKVGTGLSIDGSGVLSATGSGGGLGYVISGGSNSTASPSDAKSYYLGLNNSIMAATTESATAALIYIPKAGTLKVAEVFWYEASTNGSNETITAYVRLNNTTDYTIASVGDTNRAKRFSNTGLSISVSDGDYIQLKIATPTWATNPTGVTIGFNFYIE